MSPVPLRSLNRNNDVHLPPEIQPWRFRPVADPTTPQSDAPVPLDVQFDLRAQHADNPALVAEASHEVFKLAAAFYLTILQRAQSKHLVPRMLKALKAYINHDPRNAVWLIQEYSNWEIVEETLLQPCAPEMPKLTCGLLYSAMLVIYDSERASLASYWRATSMTGRRGDASG